MTSTLESLERELAAFHRDHPLERGMPRDAARAAVGIESRLFAKLLDAIAETVVSEAGTLRLASHRVTLSTEQQRARDLVLSEFEAAGFAPPALSKLSENHGVSLVQAMIDAGDLVRVSPEFALTSTQYERAKRVIAGAAAAEGPLTTSRIRELLGTSRKYAIPLLEHLDSTGFTKRSGDLRSLTGAP